MCGNGAGSFAGDAMIKSLQQAKRFLTILFGFTLLVLGVAMLALPGPGLVTIVLGLGILAAEYVWARRLLDRVKQQSDRIRNSIFSKDKSVRSAPASAAAVPGVVTVETRVESLFDSGEVRAARVEPEVPASEPR
jgi:uncharacterized protein (TIGR02611 family)